MARLRHLPSSLAWSLAVVIAFLERQDASRGMTTDPSSEPDEAATPSAVAGSDPPRHPPTADSGSESEPAVGRTEKANGSSGSPGTDSRSGPDRGAPSEVLAPDRSTPPAAPPVYAVPPAPATELPPAAPPPASGDTLAAPLTAAAADPLIDAEPGETIVGPDAPIRVPNGGARPVPTGAVLGDGSAVCPDDHPIKGNASSRIYHQPGQPSYERTIAEYCFASEEDAEHAGYRPPKR